MFKLDLFFIEYVLDLFSWENYSFYGCGIYVKLILLLLFGQQIFNIVYDNKSKKNKKKKGGKGNVRRAVIISRGKLPIK